MNKYAAYLKERENMEMYENEKGFVTYSFYPELQACYLAEIYIVPEFRGTTTAFNLYKRVCNLAKAEGYSKMLGSFDTTTANWEVSEKLMKKLGWQFYKKVGYLVYYIGNI
jgi:GNAT superfamily N-acetyltransferase